ncbi:MAG: DUF3048 domain-containing protein [Candidatus Magasanikbacteria bacterium]|nr:DUF3048 domain-containing protein [Candidatus Magasanikbacteria bacterium]
MKPQPKDNRVQYLYIAAAIMALFGIGLLGQLWYRLSSAPSGVVDVGTDRSPNRALTASSTPACDYRRTLDGLCVGSLAEVNPPLVAVMIENSADAWPLSGLAAARLVYEAPAEGDIPRFLALFRSDATVAKIGPVRSARPYYLDWAEEYGSPLYMHVGGSPVALERLRFVGAVLDADEFFHGPWFWRDNVRSAPHNTYTSSERWQAAWRNFGKIERAGFQSWTFSEASPCVMDCAHRIHLTAASSLYGVTWVFNTTTGRYIRYQNKTQQFDDDYASVLADTVIVQRAAVSAIDDVGRKEIKTVGGGEAIVFRDGAVFRGRWRKKNKTARTEWLDEQGRALSLKPGKIWIHILPLYQDVEWE